MVKEGTIWTSGDKNFRVLSVTNVDNNIWIHYREDKGIKVPSIECKEYSCYQESFILRFRQLPE
jgi:hypothetical protein